MTEKRPKIDPSCYVDKSAVIIGDVTLEKDCSVWPYAVIRGDENKIVIREGTNIQDGCVIHTDDKHGVEIGKNVSIGHGAIVHGAKIGDNCLIGMHATILSGAKIGKGCLIGANTLVLEDTEIPDHSLVVGVPGKVIRQDPEMEEKIIENAKVYIELAKEHKERRFSRYP
ncbi:MAG: gamma carbonic anhydrase family protein [Thermoplasmata archaeon]|nr:MAG: gamma carbonic anhydrase family protein [Thermoplasmata archaeon]